jgi:5-methylcytosine-specific restriction enzyme B
VALCKVTKGLHDTAKGEVFEFEKVEQFREPVALKQLQLLPELEKCEPLINNQGSLFRLTPNEYGIIRSIIDEENEMGPIGKEQAPIYSIEQCAEATGFPPLQVDKWRLAVERKGQAVFYGPPGTGKTFIAHHLARHIVGGGKGFVELIQFHPTYAYEDFMQGIRPDTDEKGNLTFELTSGRFISFCLKARQCEGTCVLIIDEINRANLSRVFGELMYLLEYRNREIPLAGGKPFSIPPNVCIIGTMNTADRSIALVDFALRRRFAFIELFPEYDLLLGFQKKRGFDARGLVAMLREINTRINDKNFSLGISFFMADNLSDKIEHIWTMEIEPYLEEYFFSQPETVNSFRWAKIKERVIG